MKRTGEIILTSIGIVFSVFGILAGFGWSSLFGSNVIKEEVLNDPSLNSADMSDIMTGFAILEGSGWFIVVIAVISLIVGILGIIFFMGNKKPKAAGIILIIGSVIVLVGSIGTGFFSFITYLIAGIMGVVRKSPEQIDQVTIDQTTSAE